jgi:2-dehydro-3-deoxygalactonokinase
MIAVDWGTSSFRAYRLNRDGKVLEERVSPDGILAVTAGEFPAVLDRQIAGWDEETILMSGMVGSRQGWIEVPYVQCPAGPETIAASVQKVAWPGRTAWIVPGVSCVDDSGVPDVMRGEETQILGVLDELPEESLVCLPGTHSKWVKVRGGRITAFRTCFTGELFAVLKGHSLLGRMMREGTPDERAFAEGVDRSADDGGLLHHLFGVRTRGLFGELAADKAPSYLSGLLIGHELRCAPQDARVYLLGSQDLAAIYAHAAGLLGIECKRLDPQAAPRGLFKLARARGA